MSLNKFDNFPPKIYRLRNKIQNYLWGTKNENAFIPKFLGIEPQKDLPYAELWIGTHPKLPSEILFNGEYLSLDKVIKKFPKEILGKFAAEKFNNKLPFLLKILSINYALSIQAHPDKKLAEHLHLIDPQNYPDNNHKPEIAIAIDNLELIVGVKPFDEFITAIKKYTGLKNALNLKLYDDVTKYSDFEKAEIIKKVYSELMHLTSSQLEVIIPSIVKHIKQQSKLTVEEKEFLIQYKQFGNDVGLLSILLFNNINLATDEAVFTSAGIPHAYLRGNIIECMANSDNVVRAGLTSKYKDIPTLLKMLKYDSSIDIIKNTERKQIYKYQSSAEEFEIVMYNFSNEVNIVNNDSISILLVLEGNIKAEWENGSEKINIKKGETVLIPANLNSYKILSDKNTKYISVNVPKD